MSDTECVSCTLCVLIFFYYEQQIKRELKAIHTGMPHGTAPCAVPEVVRSIHKRKKINDSWKDVSGHFYSRQCKGGGIDGQVSPRTGASDRIVLIHCAGHASRLRLVWECLLLLVLWKIDLPLVGQDSLMT